MLIGFAHDQDMTDAQQTEPNTGLKQKRGPNKWRATITRRRLITVASREFAASGYATVSIDRIVRSAAMTKGAFYHHFDSKRSILEAVVQSIQARLRRNVLRATRDIDDPWKALDVGSRAYLEAATADEGLHRLLFLDAPSALGWQRWREIDDRYWRSDIGATFRSALGSRGAAAEPMTAAISSALTHAILNIATAPDRGGALAEVEQMIDILLGSFKAFATNMIGD